MCLRFLGGPIALLIFSGAAIAQTTGTTGGSSPFDNQQPSLAVTQFLLKQGLFPAQASEFPDAGAAGMVRTQFVSRILMHRRHCGTAAELAIHIHFMRAARKSFSRFLMTACAIISSRE